jgi:hypothetical protein
MDLDLFAMNLLYVNVSFLNLKRSTNVPERSSSISFHIVPDRSRSFANRFLLKNTISKYLTNCNALCCFFNQSKASFF